MKENICNLLQVIEFERNKNFASFGILAKGKLSYQVNIRPDQIKIHSGDKIDIKDYLSIALFSSIPNKIIDFKTVNVNGINMQICR